MPLKVSKFYVLVDYVVVELEISQFPILVTFLGTTYALVAIKNGKLTLSIGDDMVEFNLSNSMKSPSLSTFEDPLYECLVDDSNGEEKIEEFLAL